MEKKSSSVTEAIKPSWVEDINQLEKKVSEGQEKQQSLNDAIAAANEAQVAYTKVVGEIEELKTRLQSTIGSIFSNQNTKVRQF